MKTNVDMSKRGVVTNTGMHCQHDLDLHLRTLEIFLKTICAI